MFSGRHGPNGWNNARRSGRRTSQLASQSQAKSSNPERSRSVPSVGVPRGSNERSRVPDAVTIRGSWNLETHPICRTSPQDLPRKGTDLPA